MTVTHHLAVHARAQSSRQRQTPEDIGRLVRAAGAGDQRAWECLVTEFSGMIWAVARAHRLNDADAADVAQTSWLALLQHIEQLNEPAAVGAWLATTARRECLRVLRTGTRTHPFGDDAPEGEAADPAPGDQLLARERDEALWRSFSQLNPSDQALLRLLLAEPRPAYEEIAAALDMAIGSIGPTRQRALKRLRRQLENHGTRELMAV